MPKVFDRESGKIVSKPAGEVAGMVRVMGMDREIWMPLPAGLPTTLAPAGVVSRIWLHAPKNRHVKWTRGNGCVHRSYKRRQVWLRRLKRH
jgi:hypothetical protein